MFQEVEPAPHLVRMHAVVASALAKRKQAAISGLAWNDWLTADIHAKLATEAETYPC
jgi:hypothetical protein